MFTLEREVSNQVVHKIKPVVYAQIKEEISSYPSVPVWADNYLERQCFPQEEGGNPEAICFVKRQIEQYESFMSTIRMTIRALVVLRHVEKNQLFAAISEEVRQKFEMEVASGEQSAEKIRIRLLLNDFVFSKMIEGSFGFPATMRECEPAYLVYGLIEAGIRHKYSRLPTALFV